MPILGALAAPNWWHHHGTKMRVARLSLTRKTLKLVGSAASVWIRCIAPRTKAPWRIDWQIVHGVDSGVNGRIWVDTKSLQSAFGLSEESGTFGDGVIERSGADVAEQGEYVRYKDFLNIPCPGTGHDGDPNVSIRLDVDIKAAVMRLIG
jgi:hypothetical protein